VLFDATGAPVAVAGAFQTFGLLEIGVDVVPAFQGRGLAPLVVRAATAAILARGAEPFYACAATNIRSHRTALAAGFLPVCSDATVAPTPSGTDG
jgi:RimJ/RimL family protein N-acetyltransferase